MSKIAIFVLLTISACLEVGGDALARSGLHSHGMPRYLLLLASAATLLIYGIAVNLGPWDFGRVLGVYVALFFLVAQIMDRLVYGIIPSIPVLIGGTLIVSGGLVLALFQG
jgi:small multidrug resistance family-3 protein